MRRCQTGLLHSQDVIHQLLRFLLSYRHAVTILWHFRITQWYIVLGEEVLVPTCTSRTSIRFELLNPENRRAISLKDGPKFSAFTSWQEKHLLSFASSSTPAANADPVKVNPIANVNIGVRRAFMMHSSKDDFSNQAINQQKRREKRFLVWKPATATTSINNLRCFV